MPALDLMQNLQTLPLLRAQLDPLLFHRAPWPLEKRKFLLCTNRTFSLCSYTSSEHVDIAHAKMAYSRHLTMPSTISKVLTLSLACLILSVIACAQAPEPSKPAKEPIAMIAGQPIYQDDLLPTVAPKLIQLRDQEYQLKKQALENLIDQKLLEAEAKKKSVSTDKLLEQAADAKIGDPTDAEVYAFYLGQKSQSSRPFDDVKVQLKASLKQAKIQQARQDFYAQLRKQSQVVVLLQAPKVEVSYDPERVRGNPKAPVMIVEFSDFQCPYCQAVESTLKTVLAKHENQVALAFRDLPLSQIHAQAMGAAEAARCAGEQGKFWEYHDLLFANQNKLDRNGLLEQAHTLKLDEKQFDSCITSEKYKAQIAQDEQDGRRAGLNGTPGFFINGVFLNGAQPEAVFETSIQDALSAPPKQPSGH
jgi:protein-disulfide isomerase